VIEVLVVSAVMGGLLAEIKGQFLVVFAAGRFGIEAGFLERERALGEPLVLGHFFDDEALEGAVWFELGLDGGVERMVTGLIFPGQDGERAAGEAVREVVERGDGFAFSAGGTGAVLSVGLVGGDLCVGGHFIYSLKSKPPDAPHRASGVWRNLEGKRLLELV
jgi:hypothetical protein